MGLFFFLSITFEKNNHSILHLYYNALIIIFF